jgi:hypothetical protein
MTKSNTQIFHKLTGLKLPDNYNAADILNRMREFCGEGKYREFILRVGTQSRDWNNNYTYYINTIYILNPSALLERAIEFLEGNENCIFI